MSVQANYGGVISKKVINFAQLSEVRLLWVGAEKRYLSELKQRLLDNFIQDWHATIRDEDRYRYFPYRHVKSTFESEQYFSVLEIYCFRVGLCQLRLAVFPINNNFHRYGTMYLLEAEIVCFV